MTQTPEREQAEARFVGRMLILPFYSLVLLALWVVVASVLTPIHEGDPQSLLTVRFLLIGAGFAIILMTVAATLKRLIRD